MILFNAHLYIYICSIIDRPVEEQFEKLKRKRTLSNEEKRITVPPQEQETAANQPGQVMVKPATDSDRFLSLSSLSHSL